ncbi:hypothetical protein M9458_012636, partial [Cirrhinus mrigala]
MKLRTLMSHWGLMSLAVDMEIMCFKETECMCLYMKEQMITLMGYKDRVGLNMEIERGKFSLELKN